jgi:hypothetical protein
MRVTSFAIGLAVASVLQPSNRPVQNLGEVTVERINVVDKNGTLRMVISDKDRMHPGVVDGVTIDRPRSVAGLLFFNDAGDEIGGITYSGRRSDSPANASATFTFDQLRQDQTIGLMYGEEHGERSVGLNVWDQPDQSMGPLIRRLNDANRITDRTQRTAVAAKARADAPAGHRRIFVGKNVDRSATVSLADADGRPRLNLTVDGNGNPRIELLDPNGKVTNRWPAQ